MCYQDELDRKVNPSLPQAAAQHLHAAGRRASERADPAAAKNLLERALALVPEGGALRARIAVDLAEQLMDVSERARADELLSLAQRDPDADALAALTRLEWQIRVTPHEAPTQTVDRMLSAMLKQLARAGDERGLARAHMAAFWIHTLAGRYTPAGAEARLAVDHARLAGDEGLHARAVTGYISSIVHGREHARTIGAGARRDRWRDPQSRSPSTY